MTDGSLPWTRCLYKKIILRNKCVLETGLLLCTLMKCRCYYGFVLSNS